MSDPSDSEGVARSRANLCLTVLALSPFPFLICLIGFAFWTETALGSLLGAVAIFGPLAFLAFGDRGAFSDRSRRTLQVALFSGVLLLVGIVLHFLPAISSQQGKGNHSARSPAA
jgi:hypothetical protein